MIKQDRDTDYLIVDSKESILLHVRDWCVIMKCSKVTKHSIMYGTKYHGALTVRTPTYSENVRGNIAKNLF